MILSKRQLSLFRGNGGGLSPLQAALAQFGFWAPLETSVALYRGYGAASFTRATTATVKDWEGAIRNCVSGEVRFAGQRRVANGVTGSIVNSSTTNTATGQTGYQGEATATRVRIDVAASYGAYMQISGSPRLGTIPAGGSLVGSMAVKGYGGSIGKVVGVGFYENGAKPLADITLTAEWQRVSVAVAVATGGADCRFGLLHGGGFGVSGSTLALNDEVLVDAFQIELTTGQSNQNPSEYVSVGAAKLNELTQTDRLTDTWTTYQATASGNAIAAPNGVVMATAILETAVSDVHVAIQSFTPVVTLQYTYSVYMKAGTRNWGFIRDAHTGGNCYFDLVNGVVGASPSLFSGVSIEAVGNGWYRCSATHAVHASASRRMDVGPATGDGGAIFLGVAAAIGIYVYGAQLTKGTSAGTYFPVGSVYPYHGACVDGVKYFSTENGNTVASNVVTEATGAAIDQTNVGYLAESARTNLVLQSSNFGTTWGVSGSPTRSAAAAYCGEIALDLIGDDDAGVMESYYQFITFTADASKSVSFLVKQGTSASSVMQIQDATAGANRLLMAITWSGGVPVCTYTTGSAERASEYMGGGVWRIFCLAAGVIAANNNWCYVYPATVAGLTAAGTGDIYIGGVQAENATTASVSHIPTTTATVTRNGDQLTFPVEGNVSQTAGAMAVSYGPLACIAAGQYNYLAEIGDGTASERIILNVEATTQYGTIVDGGAAVAQMSLQTSVPNYTVGTVAMAWAANDAAAIRNGQSVVTDATVTLPTVTKIYPGAYGGSGGTFQANGPIRHLRIATTRVTNADLALVVNA